MKSATPPLPLPAPSRSDVVGEMLIELACSGDRWRKWSTANMAGTLTTSREAILVHPDGRVSIA